MSDEPEKPDYSCPHINKIIEIENDMVRALESKHYDELETLISNVDDALWYRGDIEREAEKARDIHDQLREWGEWQQERADELEKENEELRAELKKVITHYQRQTLALKDRLAISNCSDIELSDAYDKLDLSETWLRDNYGHMKLDWF